MNEYRAKYHERALANFAVNNATKKGILIRPNECEICKQTAKVHGHHQDYNKKLEVIWVCPQCHKNIHHPNKTNAYQKKYPDGRPSKRKVLLEHAIRLKESGLSYNKIGKSLNVSKGTIYKWLNKVNYY